MTRCRRVHVGRAVRWRDGCHGGRRTTSRTCTADAGGRCRCCRQLAGAGIEVQRPAGNRQRGERDRERVGAKSSGPASTRGSRARWLHRPPMKVISIDANRRRSPRPSTVSGLRGSIGVPAAGDAMRTAARSRRRRRAVRADGAARVAREVEGFARASVTVPAGLPAGTVKLNVRSEAATGGERTRLSAPVTTPLTVNTTRCSAASSVALTVDDPTVPGHQLRARRRRQDRNRRSGRVADRSAHERTSSLVLPATSRARDPAPSSCHSRRPRAPGRRPPPGPTRAGGAMVTAPGGTAAPSVSKAARPTPMLSVKVARSDVVSPATTRVDPLTGSSVDQDRRDGIRERGPYGRAASHCPRHRAPTRASRPCCPASASTEC